MFVTFKAQRCCPFVSAYSQFTVKQQEQETLNVSSCRLFWSHFCQRRVRVAPECTKPSWGLSGRSCLHHPITETLAAHQVIRPPLDKILLGAFTGEILRVRLVVEGKLWTVLLFDSCPLLVLIRAFPPVEVPGGDGQACHRHKDDDCDNTCNAKCISEMRCWILQKKKKSVLHAFSKILYKPEDDF